MQSSDHQPKQLGGEDRWLVKVSGVNAQPLELVLQSSNFDVIAAPAVAAGTKVTKTKSSPASVNRTLALNSRSNAQVAMESFLIQVCA